MFDRLWFFLLFPGVPTAIALFVMYRMKQARDDHSILPVKRFPRPAGWGLQQRAQDLKEDLLLDVTMLLITGVIAAIVFVLGGDWIGPFVVGFTGSVFLIWRICRRLPEIWSYHLGLTGEQIVGRTLDQLASDELRVFHDLVIRIPGQKSWNIDHVVVAPDGVHVVETKTRRKARKADRGWEVTFDGAVLHFPKRSDSASLRQAENAAGYLASKLAEWNPKSIPVHPVVVIPGWMIQRKGRGRVSVLNQNELAKYLTGRPRTMEQNLQRAVANQIDERCQVEMSGTP